MRKISAAVLLILAGCASAGRPAVDPDIVYMPGVGGAAGAANLNLPPMTFDELLNCAYKVRDLNEQDARIDAEAARTTQVRGQLEQRGNGLDAERATVNTRDGKAVDNYNSRLEAHRKAVDAFNLDVQKHNATIDARNQLRNTFNAGCANRPYRRSDYARIPAALRAIIDANSK